MNSNDCLMLRPLYSPTLTCYSILSRSNGFVTVRDIDPEIDYKSWLNFSFTYASEQMQWIKAQCRLLWVLGVDCRSKFT